MKALWWFEDQKIAGMARPGFNSKHWFDFTYEEALVMGWVGLHSSGTTRFNDFQKHVREYGDKIFPYYSLREEEKKRVSTLLATHQGLSAVFEKVAKKSEFLSHFEVYDDLVSFELSHQRLLFEIDYLRRHKIARVVSLTESHHAKDHLEKHFDAHHFPIVDMEAPDLGQPLKLAEIFQEASLCGEGVAVHCLAGIGRTSTMILAAHLAMGKLLDELTAFISKKNPAFSLTGSQKRFLEAFAAEHGISTR